VALTPFLPEIVLALAAMAILLGETVWPRVGRLWVIPGAAAVGAAALLAAKVPSAAGGMFVMDGMARFLKIASASGTVLTLGLSAGMKTWRPRGVSWGAYVSLILLSTLGLMLLVSSADWLMLVVSLELVSVTCFILAGFLKDDRRGSEAAIKYFLMGAFSAGLMLYGISLYYGVFGTTSLTALRTAHLAALPRLPVVGAAFFVLAGLGFKMALVPFHMWAPDVYEGAPLPVTAFISSAPKAAAFGALLRALPNLDGLGIAGVVAILSLLTMTVGNIGALRQTNIKRLLAYSSIAQMGYVLMGAVAGGDSGRGAVLIYVLFYLFMNLGAFACAAVVCDDAGTEDLGAFSGLARRSLPLALCATIFFLSLTGIPPLAGFVGKFSLFAAALEHGWAWLAVAAVINSVVSLAYYAGIVRRMFFDEAAHAGRVGLSFSLAVCAAAAVAVTLAAGLFPDRVLGWVRSSLP
jgi:NADH-quinone oxidoreductase subunit N